MQPEVLGLSRKWLSIVRETRFEGRAVGFRLLPEGLPRCREGAAGFQPTGKEAPLSSTDVSLPFFSPLGSSCSRAPSMQWTNVRKLRWGVFRGFHLGSCGPGKWPAWGRGGPKRTAPSSPSPRAAAPGALALRPTTGLTLHLGLRRGCSVSSSGDAQTTWEGAAVLEGWCGGKGLILPAVSFASGWRTTDRQLSQLHRETDLWPIRSV